MKTLILTSFIFLLFGTSYAQRSDLFGLSIGQAFEVKECELKSFGYAKPAKGFCYQRRDASTQYKGIADAVYIEYAPNSKPGIIKGYSINALILDNKVESYSFTTYGLNNQNEVLTALTELYGKPDARTNETIKTAANSFERIKAHWMRGNITISFNSAESSIKEGIVIVESDKAKIYRTKLAATK